MVSKLAPILALTAVGVGAAARPLQISFSKHKGENLMVDSTNVHVRNVPRCLTEEEILKEFKDNYAHKKPKTDLKLPSADPTKKDDTKKGSANVKRLPSSSRSQTIPNTKN